MDASDHRDLFLQNHYALTESRLSFDTTEDLVIWEWCQEFVRSHGHVPSSGTVRSHFESAKNTEVLERLDRLAPLKPLVRGDFRSYLEDKANERRARRTLELAKEMAAIVSTGIDLRSDKGKPIRLQGPLDAIRHVMDQSHEIVSPTLGGALSGNLLADGQTFLNRYDQVKNDPRAGLGQFTGIAQIDEHLKGAKKKELWIHAAFTGHLKTFFATHWAYVQAVYFGGSTLYFSLEVPYHQVMNFIYTMHSAHEDFGAIRQKLGIQGLGLEYHKIRDGKLSKEEEAFLKDYVVPDFNRTPTVPHNGPHSLDPTAYGNIQVEVQDPDKLDYTVVDLRTRAELLNVKTPFDMIMVDHAGLLSSRKRHASTTESLNEVLRDLKKLSGAFNRGSGIAVVGLFQISRDGYKTALKSGGRYNLTALSYANECERSADVVTASYVDEDLKGMNRTLFQCLKARDHEPFPMIPVRVEYANRRLLTDRTPYDDIRTKIDESKGTNGSFPGKSRRKGSDHHDFFGDDSIG